MQFCYMHYIYISAWYGPDIKICSICKLHDSPTTVDVFSKLVLPHGHQGDTARTLHRINYYISSAKLQVLIGLRKHMNIGL
jgi:hypothetical protein